MSFIGGTAQGGFEEGIKQGIIGGVTAGLTKGLADKIGHGYKPGPVVGQMMLQGAIAELKGGKFKHGAISALAGKMGSHYGAKYFPTASQNDKFGRAAVSAMFGGLGAEASGGSFEDGAMTALFVHLFNDKGRNKNPPLKARLVTTGDFGHSGLYVEGANGDSVLWDPGGSYSAKKLDGYGQTRPMANDSFFGDIFVVDFDDYVKYQSEDGSTVVIQNISITSDQADDLIYQIEGLGEVMGGFCAKSIGDVLYNNVPAYKGWGGVSFPFNLFPYRLRDYTSEHVLQ